MPIERETIITNEPARPVAAGGSPFGTMIAALVGAVVLVLLVLWLLSGGLHFSGGHSGGAVNVNLPKVHVNTNG